MLIPTELGIEAMLEFYWTGRQSTNVEWQKLLEPYVDGCDPYGCAREF